MGALCCDAFATVSRLLDDLFLLSGRINQRAAVFPPTPFLPPTYVGDTGLLSDLLCNDPEPKNTDWGSNDRGAPCRFGPDAVTKFLARATIQIYSSRAHQIGNRTMH